MRHAFFADMGGFILHTKDSKPFPINAKQLHWLVVKNYVEYPQITREEIWDKSKQDSIAKALTVFQITYLVIQCVGRAIQGLTITTLELNTLAIVVCSLFTSFAWYHKPHDVRTPTALHSKHTVKDMSRELQWRQTPLDFVDENGPGWSLNVQQFMKMPVIPAERPIQRIPDDRFPMNPYGAQEYCLCLATLLFTAIHVAGWHFSFPSETEKILWRVASLLLFGITAAFWVLETMASWIRLGRWRRLYLKATDTSKLEHLERIRSRILTEDFKPTVLPLAWEFWSILPLVVIFGIARAYLLVEPFMELRDIEATAFVNVDWSTYFPQLGA